MSEEEEKLLQQLVKFKEEYEKLFVIYEELDEMMKDGYSCSSCPEQTSNLRYAYEEYRAWRSKSR